MNHPDLTALSFDNLDSLSPGEIRKRFDELRAYTFELETQNEELRKSEETHRNLFETMSQGIVYQSTDGRIISANPAAERNYLTLFREMLNGFALHEIICDAAGVPTDYRFLDVNPAFERITGLKRTEIVGRTVLEIMPDIEPYWIETFGRVALTGESTHFEKFATGVRKHFKVTAFQSQPAQFACIYTDITEQKKIEEALRESEASLRAITGSAHDAILLMDPDGSITFWNPAAERIFGYTSDEVIGTNLHRLIAPQRYHAAHNAAFAGFQQTGKGAAIDVTLGLEARHKDGHEVPIELSLSALHLQDGWHTIGIIRNITERKQAEEMLRESEARFRALHNASFGGIVIHDQGIILDCNQGFSDQTGYTIEELIGMDGLDLIAPEWRELVRRNISQSQEQPYDAEGLRKDGTRYPLTIRGKTTPYKGRTVRVTEFRDITERKKAEEALRREQIFSKSVIESLPGIFYLYSYTDLRLILWNREHESLLGYISEETKGRHVTDWHVPEAKEAVLNTIEDVMTQGRASIEASLVAKDGHLVPFILTGVKFEAEGQLYLMGIGIDITERRQAEDRLRETVARFKALFNATSDSVILIEPDGTILDLNENSARRRDVGPSAMLGKSLFSFLPPEAAFSRQRAVSEILAEKRLVQYEEMRNGKYYSIRLYPVLDALGKVIQVASFSRDITEHKMFEETMSRLQAQLHQSQKMEAVGQLAGGVAHDFNNMLGVILGHAELAMERVKPPNPLLINLEEIRKAAQHSAEITRQLLAFARKQTVAPKIIDLNETVEGMLKMLRRLIGEDIHLAWLPATSLWPVKVDPSQIDQILANLCVNARDAITGNGNIVVETGNSTFDEEYCAAHVGFATGEYVRLTVSDSGCGMDQSTLAHIFEPFFTTKGIGQGTGLGLATVYGAVKQNNGFINAYSEPGTGTKFTIYLPRYIGDAMLEPTEDTAEPALQGDETILLVEDDPSILKMATMMLQFLGYTVLAAGTPVEAISLAGEYKGQIHLLLTDVIMPEMNGRDLVGKLAEKRPDLKCLFMSGYTANVITHHGVLDEGVNFIQKPFSKNDLAIKIRQVLGQGSIGSGLQMFPDQLEGEPGGGDGAAAEDQEEDQPQDLQADNDAGLPEQAEAVADDRRSKL
jgi:two-component system, cell cycle sensor histidine kinase and response regulator CckA